MDMAPRAASRRPDAGRRPALPLLAAAVMLGSGAAAAQTTIVSPTFDARLTWTDNASASGLGGFGGLGGGRSDRRGADWILELSPGISMSRDSGRLSGTLSANFRNLMYASSADDNTSYLALAGNGTFEAIEDMLFIDADASISRNNLSVFSTRGPNDELDVSSDNETRVFSLSPRFQFRIGNDTRGSLQYRWRWADSGASRLADQNESQWSAQISNTQITGIFGLGLDYNRSSGDSDNASGALGGGPGSGSGLRGGKTREIARATLYAKVTPEFRLRGIVGRESNDYGSRGEQSSTVTGGGFDWNPTNRTAISGTVERRIFGRGYDFSFQHRLARTTLFASFRRDIQSSLDLVAGGGLLDPLFQPLFNDPLLVALYRDPLVRRDAVLLLLRRLRGDVLTNAYFVSRDFSGGVTYSLPRGVLSLTLSRSENTRLGSAEGLGPVDDFRNFNDVKSKTVTLSYSHRLTPQTSLSTSVSRSNSEGSGAAAADSQRTSFVIGLSSSLGPKTSGSLQYRHQRSDGDSFGSGTNDFTENAVTASVGMRF
ncbi:TIGR03016 family PEP-CTERM system-associated outer membrane protein [Thauera sinica]|uniref:TIGR03016 family PEP-CTERM system-associated outer membrane protein n=1 Tax=Thauera sinica TaxID=2665146 RepID=A0ABW1AYK8_9RHOO|nr:TIGR03016 family PEP-CTERM system-associated outer membrane protein [Thauera sp. K11]